MMGFLTALLFILIANQAFSMDRIATIGVYDSGGDSTISTTLATVGNEDKITVSASSSRTLSFNLPAMSEGGLIFFAVQDASWNISASYSTDSTDGVTGTFTDDDPNIWTDSALIFREQVAYIPPISQPFWFKMNFQNTAVTDKEIRHIHARDFSSGSDHYFIAAGDSLTEYGMRYNVFNPYMQTQFGQDPLYLNRGVGGSNIGTVSSTLSTHIAQHPSATHVLLHIGTNDISTYGNYDVASAGNKTTFQTGYQELIDRIQAAGMTPVPMRISYRSDGYDTDGWNINIVDPIIVSETTVYNDTVSGTIDLYNFVKDTSNTTLSSDALHYSAIGQTLVNKYQAYKIGEATYGYPAGEVSAAVVNGAAHNICVNFGQTGDAVQDPDEEGNTWNDTLASFSGFRIDNLYNMEEERTAVAISSIVPFTNDFSNGYVEENDRFPTGAQRGYYYINSGASSTYVVEGLRSGTYTFEFYGSRATGSTLSTSYYIDGVSETINVGNNVSTTALFSGVTPVGGAVTATVEGVGTLGYMNALCITEE